MTDHEALAAAMETQAAAMLTFAEAAAGLTAQLASLRGALRSANDESRTRLASTVRAAQERKRKAEEHVAELRGAGGKTVLP